MKEYKQGRTVLEDCSYPHEIAIDQALDIASPLWNILVGAAEGTNTSDDAGAGVPFCVRRQLVDLKHVITRCNEEVGLVQAEMKRCVDFSLRQMEVLSSWAMELTFESNDSPYTRGLLAVVLMKQDECQSSITYLKKLFDSHYGEETDPGVLNDDAEPGGDISIEADGNGDYGNGDGVSNVADLECSDVFEDLRCILNTEYGSEGDSDSESDSDSDTQ